MLTETEIQKHILDYLKYINIFHWRSNNIAAPNRKFTGLKGLPDISCIHKGHFIGIEVKTGIGILSDDQKAFKENCEKNGGIYIVARSVDDIKHLINL